MPTKINRHTFYVKLQSENVAKTINVTLSVEVRSIDRLGRCIIVLQLDCVLSVGNMEPDLDSSRLLSKA